MNEKQKKELNEIITSTRQISCNDLFQFISPFVIGLVASEAIKTTKQVYKIKRDLSIKNVEILKSPNIHKISEFKKNEIKENFKKEYVAHIEKFYTVISNIPTANTKMFKRNIADLNIKKMIKNKRNRNIKGFYDCNNNDIYLDIENSIFHELFHMSNTIVTNEMVFTGFQQSSLYKNFDIGMALNEGYTGLLTSRYFNITSYPIESTIAKKIEEIVGQEKMEEMYFNADLYNLTQELKKYNDEREIIKFIKNLDFIKEHLRTAKTVVDKRACTQIFIKINEFLIKTYSNKLKDMYDKNKITNEQISTTLDLFVESLNDLTNNKLFEPLNKQLLKNMNNEMVNEQITSINILKGRTM